MTTHLELFTSKSKLSILVNHSQLIRSCDTVGWFKQLVLLVIHLIKALFTAWTQFLEVCSSVTILALRYKSTYVSLCTMRLWATTIMGVFSWVCEQGVCGKDWEKCSILCYEQRLFSYLKEEVIQKNIILRNLFHYIQITLQRIETL